MDSIKAPASLPYRGTRAEMSAANAASHAFAAEMKAVIIADILAKSEAVGSDLPAKYIVEAASKISIRHTADWMGQKYRSNHDKSDWGLVWYVKGTARGGFGETKMVIRKDGTVNISYLYDRIHNEAWDAFSRDQNRLKRDEVARQLGGYTPPEGYTVEATSHGARVICETDAKWTTATKLDVIVNPDQVDALIMSHRIWVKAFSEARK